MRGAEGRRPSRRGHHRGGRFWVFYSYNPPKTMLSWVNAERLERKRRDDTPDSKVKMNTRRRELGIRVHAAGKARMRRLSYEWLAGLREIVIEPDRCPLAFTEFISKEFQRDKEGNWIDGIPDGNGHSIDAVRYAMMDDALRG